MAMQEMDERFLAADLVDSRAEVIFDAKNFGLEAIKRILASHVLSPEESNVEIVLNGEQVITQATIKDRLQQDGERYFRTLATAMIYSHVVSIRYDLGIIPEPVETGVPVRESSSTIFKDFINSRALDKVDPK